ncbi:meiosis-specific with OB domain-containing protein [Chrysoperla carnea]|uniref:meiosis-specific with OB domain-containing protein n=1 Tax=Chrysoperla carnea TaxID=189513 RepID=UPI001D081D47|nr:meiosis-specific with OB domain-containing protein [Chrysoperla carnea]
MSGLMRVCIKDLNSNIGNSLIVGIIIGKRRWNTFSSLTKAERAVWSFTLRDSAQDTINVTCWGSVTYIQTLHDSFHIGDVVDIIKAQIRIRSPGERSESFQPVVNSPFALVYNEGQSQLQFHDGDNINYYTSMMQIPSKKISGTCSLYDIQNSATSMSGVNVDLLVGVRTVGPVKTVTAGNEQKKVRNIIVMDQTNSGIPIALWEEDDIIRASQWEPRKTVLFISDCRIAIRNGSHAILLTPQTIITANPSIKASLELVNFMSNSTPIPISHSFIVPENIPNPEFISNVISVAQLIKKMEYFNSNPNIEVQFSGVTYAFITDFNLETQSVVLKCGICKWKIDPQIGICFNQDCPAGSGSELVAPNKVFDILVSLADHTGEIKNVHLLDDSAEKVLEMKV